MPGDDDLGAPRIGTKVSDGRIKLHTHTGFRRVCSGSLVTSWAIEIARINLTGFRELIIEPLRPTKMRGVPRIDDQRVLAASSGCCELVAHHRPAFWTLWPAHDLCQSLHPVAKTGHRARIPKAVSATFDDDVQMIAASSIHVHQYAANSQKRPTGIPWIRLQAGTMSFVGRGRE